MATASVTYPTFTANTDAKASEVQQNFTDLVNFLNNEAIQKDGSKAMTGQLSLVGNPTLDAHAARKKYVDDYIPRVANTTVAAASGIASGTAVATLTITDPGYDIDLWGFATVNCTVSSALSYWGMVVTVSGVSGTNAGLVVPFPSSTAALSIGVPIRKVTHSTGSNTVVTLTLVRFTGSGTITIVNLGSEQAAYNSLEVQYRKKYP